MRRMIVKPANLMSSKTSYIALVVSTTLFILSFIFSIFVPKFSDLQTEHYENLVLLKHDETAPVVMATAIRDDHRPTQNFDRKATRRCPSFHIDSAEAAVVGKAEETIRFGRDCSLALASFSAGDQVEAKYDAEAQEFVLVDETFIDDKAHKLLFYPLFSQLLILVTVISGISMLGLIWMLWRRKRLVKYWSILGVSLFALGFTFAIDASALNSRLSDLESISNNAGLATPDQVQATVLGTIILPNKNENPFQMLVQGGSETQTHSVACPIFELTQSTEVSSGPVIDRFTCGRLNLNINDQVSLRYDDSVSAYVLQGATGEAQIDANLATLKTNLRNSIVFATLLIVSGIGLTIVFVRRSLYDAGEILGESQAEHNLIGKFVALTLGSMVVGGGLAYFVGVLEKIGSHSFVILANTFMLLVVFIGFIVFRSKLVKSLQERAFAKYIRTSGYAPNPVEAVPTPKRSTGIWCSFVASFAYFCFIVMMYATSMSSSGREIELEMQISPVAETLVVAFVLFLMSLLFVWFSVERQVRTYVKNLESDRG